MEVVLGRIGVIDRLTRQLSLQVGDGSEEAP